MNRKNNVADDRGAQDRKPDLLNAGDDRVERIRWCRDQWQPGKQHRVSSKQRRIAAVVRSRRLMNVHPDTQAMIAADSRIGSFTRLGTKISVAAPPITVPTMR